MKVEKGIWRSRADLCVNAVIRCVRGDAQLFQRDLNDFDS
jgi:hypothetical protein